MATEPSASNQDPTLYCAYFGGPRDGLKSGDLPASFSGMKLTGMVSKTPLTQPAELSDFAVYECVSEEQVNGFWEFLYQGMEGPNGEALGWATPDHGTAPTDPADALDTSGHLKADGMNSGKPGMPDQPRYSCGDMAEFNSLLLKWLEETTDRTVGPSSAETYAVVELEGIPCQLSGETTRAGVRSYLTQLLSGNTKYSIVASSKGVIHRVAVGQTEKRIPGFYMYTQDEFEAPQMIAPVDAPAFTVISVARLILEAVAVLHARGHQRLRAFPNVSGSGFWWRIAICSVDTLAGNAWPYSVEPGAVFRYTMAAGFEIDGLRVGPDTSADEVADAILESLSDTGLGRDWAYTGWFAELLGIVRKQDCLPVGDEPIDSDDGRQAWPFTKQGLMIDEPPHGQRIL